MNLISYMVNKKYQVSLSEDFHLGGSFDRIALLN